MKHFLLTFSIYLTVKSVVACSCSPTISFCNAYSGFSISVSAQIIDTFSTGTTFKILSLLNGTESRDTIKVFDLSAPPYNMCSEENRARYGTLGDTVILSLNRIDTVKNVWDEIGEYRAVGFTCNTNFLWVRKSIITGRISGFEYCHIYNNCLDSYNYSAFIDEWNTRKFNCGTWLSIVEKSFQKMIFAPNPFSENVSYTDLLHQVNKIQVFDVSGKEVQVKTENNQITFPIDCSNGIYLFKTMFRNGDVSFQKLLKQK